MNARGFATRVVSGGESPLHTDCTGQKRREEGLGNALYVNELPLDVTSDFGLFTAR